MYLRFTRTLQGRQKHRYWSIVESKRCAGARVQRPVLYLGEINDSQATPGSGHRAFAKTADIIVSWRCFRPNRPCRTMPKPMACRCGSTRCNCIGRGNGAPAFWPVSLWATRTRSFLCGALCQFARKARVAAHSADLWCAIADRSRQ